MKLSCLQKNLLDALTIVGRAVPTRSSLPVLSNVLLATEDGRLKLAATNLEMAITIYIGAMVEEEGAITLPARLLTEWVSLQEKDARIEMTLNPRNRKMRLVSGRFDANISGIDAEEFPAIPVVEEGTAASFDAAQFKAAVEQV
ncbi:MAG: DNA polymerase III subunit beta, partial [Chloroflexi bacterium]|nr:DNA polymerase III subunit beta [Chloroflexota bacterium]